MDEKPIIIKDVCKDFVKEAIKDLSDKEKENFINNIRCIEVDIPRVSSDRYKLTGMIKEMFLGEDGEMRYKMEEYPFYFKININEHTDEDALFLIVQTKDLMSTYGHAALLGMSDNDIARREEKKLDPTSKRKKKILIGFILLALAIIIRVFIPEKMPLIMIYLASIFYYYFIVEGD